MTWLEFKTEAERQGVTDDSILEQFSVKFYNNPKLVIEINPYTDDVCIWGIDPDDL